MSSISCSSCLSACTTVVCAFRARSCLLFSTCRINQTLSGTWQHLLEIGWHAGCHYVRRLMILITYSALQQLFSLPRCNKTNSIYIVCCQKFRGSRSQVFKAVSDSTHISSLLLTSKFTYYIMDSEWARLCDPSSSILRWCKRWSTLHE